MNLLDDIQRARAVIMIDATRDGRPAGTVRLLRPTTVGAIPQGLSAHDFGLKDLFAAAALLGAMPEVHLFTISVETVKPMCLELSPPVAGAIPEVLQAVRALAAKGQKKILLNLGDVNYIDSSGIGELVSAFTTVRNQGGELKLLNLTKKVHDLLQITKLYTVFDVKDDEASAVKSFG